MLKKKMFLCLLMLALGVGVSFAQAPVVNPGWEVFVIREGATEAPFIVDNDDYVVDSIEVGTTEGGQKVGLATDLLNGATVGQIATLHIDRLDDVASSGSPYGPYFNIWITDGLGHYAVIANEPSNPEWGGDPWDVADWTELSTKVCKVYETPGWNTNNSWVHVHAGITGSLTFADVSDLVIAPPSPAYIQDGANGVGSGAPDVLGTDVAYGYNWVFGDTAANYVTGGDGFIVNNYSATKATLAVHNVTQGTYFNTIEAALAVAAAYDAITIADGIYNPPSTLSINIPLTLTGASEAGVVINIPAAGGYGFSVAASDVTLEYFTLAANPANQNFPIHASGTSNPPNGFDNLTIRNATIRVAHRRACFDVHGFNTVVLSHLTAQDSWGGNGVQITGCMGVTVDNITTLNNAWGSLAIYCSKASLLNRPSSNVTFDGATLNFDGAFFSQDEFGLTNFDIVVTGWDYNVYNSHFREAFGYTDSEGYTFFAPNQATAYAIATSFSGYEMYSAMFNKFASVWEVVPGITIQAAVDHADAADSIDIGIGTFTEQVWITTNDLTITGAGVGSTVVEAPATTMTNYYTNGTSDNYPVFGFNGSTGCEVSLLTIDGANNAANNHRFSGFGLWNSGAWIHDVDVTGITHNPFNGLQGGNGFDVANDTGGPYTLQVSDCFIDDIQKTGMALRGEGLTVDLDDIIILGQGVTTLIAQNGIQLSPGVTGTLDDVDISDFAYFTGTQWVSTAMLAYGPGPYTMTNVNVTDCEWGLYTMDYNGSINGGSIINPVATEMGLGIGLMIDWYDTAKAGSSGNSLVARTDARPQPDFNYVPTHEKLDVNIAVNGVSFASNSPAFQSQAIVSSSNGTNTISVDNCDISGWTHCGILWDDDYSATGDIVSTWRNNSLIANGGYGIYATGPNIQDAADNWWGHASGPLDESDDTATGGLYNPLGQGSYVSDKVNYYPWTGAATVTIDPVAPGPINCSASTSLSFWYNPAASTLDLHMFNATISAGASVTFGTITNDDIFNGTGAWYVTDNPDGSKTITASTYAGSTHDPYEASNGSAKMFTIEFVAASEGTATIAMENIVFRDPNNATIPADLPASVDIVVDCTAPAAVTNITATPHHRKIGVDWNHTGADVDHYEVFSGVWHDGSNISVYPEYDDVVGNTTPTRPSDYAAVIANVLLEWDPLGSVAALTTEQTWTTTPDRGVYYYEVFAVDAAGNASLPAAANDHATNYWLGDIDDSGTVAVYDMSVLGAAFGTSDGPVPYNNLCDVGPTDDWSRVGIPLTDNYVNFEDLMVFSMNYGVVSATNKVRAPISTKANLAWVSAGEGQYALRLVDGTGIKGIQVRASVPEGSINSITAGHLLDEQGEMTFLRNIGNALDVSVAVMGVGNGFIGSGDLMVVDSNAPIAMADLDITIRGYDNSEIQMSLEEASGTLTPRVFALEANYPNPFNPQTKISFSLPEAQDVRLNIYGVDGAKVATLVNETRAAGLHEVIWMGRNDAGQAVASGLYFYRIEAGPYSQVRKMTLMK